MKIKTITCHNVYNFGASLQAHALMYYLQKLGHDVEIIDYMPDYIRQNLSLWAIGTRWKKNLLIRLAFYIYVVPIRLLQIRTRKKYKSYNKKYFKLTRCYNSFQDLQKNPPQADLILCGSDQIWNPLIRNGLDKAFYCDFMPDSTYRASYAASFSVSTIPSQYADFIAKELKKMDLISVRENSGLSILRDLGITGGCLVVDPVFLKTKEEWLDMTYTPKYSNYILVYDQENSKLIKDIAVKMSRENGKKIVAFKDLYPRFYANYVVSYADPIDFISLIAHADCVITNSFHCTAFSIIMEKNFYVIKRTHQKVNSRMTDLLSVLDIKDRIINSLEDIYNSKSIDYDKISSCLHILKSKSLEFLNRCINLKK